VAHYGLWPRPGEARKHRRPVAAVVGHVEGLSLGRLSISRSSKPIPLMPMLLPGSPGANAQGTPNNLVSSGTISAVSTALRQSAIPANVPATGPI
jgi:hypothetical protein